MSLFTLHLHLAGSAATQSRIMALPNTILFKALPNSPNNFRKPNTQIYVNLLFKEMINSLLFANTNKSSNFSWTLNAQHPHELWTKEASPTVFLIRISPGTTACIIASVCVCVRVSLGVLGVGCLLVGLICLMMKISGTQGTWWGG